MDGKNRYKVAVVMITLNEPYWVYAKRCIDSLKKFFLQGHEVEFLVWTDMPPDIASEIGANVIVPTEPFEWPLPTLYRFSLFLREEKRLEDYDYIFYCDSDMEAVSRI